MISLILDKGQLNQTQTESTLHQVSLTFIIYIIIEIYVWPLCGFPIPFPDVASSQPDICQSPSTKFLDLTNQLKYIHV